MKKGNPCIGWFNLHWIALFLFLLLTSNTIAQNNPAFIEGRIKDENEQGLPFCNVLVLGRNTATQSDSIGYFKIKVPSKKALALIFSYQGYQSTQRNFYLNPGETISVLIRMTPSKKLLEAVVVTDQQERTETGLIKINPKNAAAIPTTAGGVESIIKTLVGSNNELTSQYSVRGGNYDENIIYINDLEIYRPYLVSNGQQEGLSLINPALVKNVQFYTGGFQAKYGDKMSSVLDIQYKTPNHLKGSAYISLLEQGLHLENSFNNKRGSYLIGIRNKSNRNILSNQPTIGSYIPSAADVQSLITYAINSKWRFELLGIFSGSRFNYYPESVKKTSSVFSPLYTANLGLDTYFEGQENDEYTTNVVAASMVHSPNQRLKLKWMLSHFEDKEKERYDITGSYLFGDRDVDNTSGTFGEIIHPLGAGSYQQYARNQLRINVWNASHKGSFNTPNHFIQWGNSIEHTQIKDQIREFQYQDSAGYSLPHPSSGLAVYQAVNSDTALTVQKFSGYLQDNIRFNATKSAIALQVGCRYHYNTLNKELIVSPRVQASWKPLWKKDIVWRIAAGIYNQPPFYRELRKYDGSLQTNLLSQKSIQVVAGMDYQFQTVSKRPFRLSTEVYYKSMRDIIPYDIDNVKIKYLAGNNAKAYAAGIDIRLFGELVKDAESWISFGLMQTKENLSNDFYYDYTNAAGEIISAASTDQTATDSIKNDIGYVRRPTDRLITVGLFLQDYLATNKNFKVHLNMLYGSNMPYNIPNSAKYRNGLIIDPYIRVDIGFSALLLGEDSYRRSHSPFRNLENVWLSLEVFNLINKANTISYQLIKDYSNSTYAIPNKLTPRLLNLKLIASF